MIKRYRCSVCLFVAILFCASLSPAGEPNPVSSFTIVGPAFVETGTPFEISVMENDADGRPIAPLSGDTVSLTAFVDGFGSPVSISPTSFSASGSGIDHVAVTISGVASGTRVFFQATGYGVLSPSGPNARGILSVDSGDFGVSTNRFGISVPSTANPNEAFPIYITPIEATGPEGSETHAPSGYTGDLLLESEYGSVTPELVSLDLAAGAAHRVMVSLSEIRPDNMIHAIVPSGPEQEYNVTFKNKDASAIAAVPVDHVLSTIQEDNSPLGAFGITTDSDWQTKIWPIQDSDHFDGGWNVLSFIPGSNPEDDNTGLNLHQQLLPGSLAQNELPGDGSNWGTFTFTTDPSGWDASTGAFPDDFAGTYWRRRMFSAHGAPGTVKTNHTFQYDSDMFDQVLTIINPDGFLDEGDNEPISDFGVDQATWNAMIWSVPGASPADTVYHMQGGFDISDPQESESDTFHVELLMTFVPSSRSAPDGFGFTPDSLWNENFIVDHSTEFLSVTGDPCPPGLDGSYWTRIFVLSAPNDGDHVGWSGHINTTGQHISPNSLHVHDAAGSPGSIVSVEVSIDLEEGQDAAAVQFDIAADEGADFQGTVNHQDGFQISTSNPSPGVTRVLMVSLEGRSTGGDENGHHVLMELIYELDSGLSYGDELDLDVTGSIISNPSSAPLPHDAWNASIYVGERGDLAGNDGIIDVTDLTSLIRLILDIDPVGEPESFGFYQADINDDGEVDILDAVRIINIILGNATAKPLAGPVGPVTLDLGDLSITNHGHAALPVSAQFDGAVAGMQITLSFDPSRLSVGSAIPANALSGMMIEQHVSSGTVRLLVYSIDGNTFSAGRLETLFNLPVEFIGTEGGDVSIEQAIFAGPQAESVSVSLANSSVKLSASPPSFDLKNNSPNPFNPSTRISYEVPQQARITLSVFNVLGQEIVRLVDQFQAPGRYSVTWDGRNMNGIGVASGVYLYRLTSGSGYSESRRMMLLK